MNGPTICMAKLLTEVMPPIIMAAGKKQRFSVPNTTIQTRQPDAVPAFVTFMVSPLLFTNLPQHLYRVFSYNCKVKATTETV
jgi:hypothetical protein